MKEYHESLSSGRENDGTERIYRHCQQVKDSGGPNTGVGVAENPRSGVGARGSSVKKGRINGKSCCALPSIALPLLNLLTVVNYENRRILLRKKFVPGEREPGGEAEAPNFVPHAVLP
jgi:hypothetical protein